MIQLTTEQSDFHLTPSFNKGNYEYVNNSL